MAKKTLEQQLQEAKGFLKEDPENAQLKKNIEDIEAKIAAKADKAKEDAEAKADKAKEDAEAFNKYGRFAVLHHLQYNGNDQRFDKKLLKEGAINEYEKLEKELKSWEGKKAKKSATVYAAGLAKNIKLVKGYALPEALYDEIRENEPSIVDLYF